MSDAVVLSVALAVCVVPGLVVLAALGLRSPLLLGALAVPASVGVAGLTGVLAGALGVAYGPVALGAVTVAVAAAGLARLLRSRRLATEPPRVRARGQLLTQIVGTGGILVGAGFGVASWLRSIGGLATVPQEHDMIVHTLLTSYISRTGRGAPWQLLPADVLSGEPVYFYPAGLHLLAATTADLTGGGAVPALNAVTVVVLGLVLSVGAAALGAVAARQLRLSRGSAALVAGVASLVAAGLYRPTFELAHDGGALPNAAALAMTPAVVAGLLMLPRLRRSAAVGVGIACAGVVHVHPSAAVSVGLTAVAWWAGNATAGAGRRELRRLPVPLLVTGLTGAVLLAPLLLSAASAAARTSAFPPDTVALGFSQAIGATLALAYGGYLDPQRATGQLAAAVLLAVGIAAVLVLRRGHGPVAAWALWAAVTIGYFLSPGSGPETIVTGVFYKAMVRVWSHVSLVVPVLVGLGVVLCASRLAVLLRRHVRRVVPVRVPALAAALAVLGFAAYAAGPAVGYAAKNTAATASRYADPDFVRVDADDERAIAWAADHVRPGQRVLNSPNDGSTYLYVERGVPVVNVYTLGLDGVPYSYTLLESFNRYPTDPAVRRMLLDLDVAWVYVDSRAPTIGADGSPRGWAGTGLFTVAPGLQDLAGLPGLQPAFRSGTVTIYSLDLGRLTVPV